MTDALRAYRDEFGEPAGYLNFASVGPPSRRVISAVTERLEDSGAGISAPGTTTQALSSLRRLTGFPEPQIALSPSTSHALHQLAFALPSGTVLVSRDEFPGNLYPWWRARERGLLDVREITSSERPSPADPDAIARSLDAGVTAVSVSAIDFRTGYRADLAAIRDVIGNDRLLIVDAIQGFGAVDMPWTAADAVVSGGQKWLRAGSGTGFLALSQRALSRLAPIGGWAGVEDPELFDGMTHAPAPGAERMLITKPSPLASAALAAATELLEEVGISVVARAIDERVAHLHAALDAAGMELLSPRRADRRGGIVVFRAVDAVRLAGWLGSSGITVTAHAPDRIRASVHATSEFAALDRLVSAAAEFRETARPTVGQRPLPSE